MAEEKPRILVVDDESDTLLYLFNLLSSVGFRVEGSSSALDALDYVARRMPDLVLCDAQMPEMDGLELLGRIKGVAPKTRVLLLSGCADESMRQETLARGGEGLLEKSMIAGEIVQAVERILEGVIP